MAYITQDESQVKNKATAVKVVNSKRSTEKNNNSKERVHHTSVTKETIERFTHSHKRFHLITAPPLSSVKPQVFSFQLFGIKVRRKAAQCRQPQSQKRRGEPHRLKTHSNKKYPRDRMRLSYHMKIITAISP